MIEVQNLSKYFGKKQALVDINLRLGKGIHGLLGPNGSGKTTLMRCLAGVLRPSCGTTKQSDMIGYLPQRFNFYRELTLYETMEYFASLKKISRHQQRDAIMRLLHLVHLDERAKSKLRTLSGGMIRRMGIAQALLGNPPLVLVDEPTAGLDPEERLSFKNIISDLNPDSCIIISTHIVEDVEALCKRIIILDEGKVVADKGSDALKEYARGSVYRVLADHQADLLPPYEILRRERSEEQEYLRILSPNDQNAKPVHPTIEDGYIMVIRGYPPKSL